MIKKITILLAIFALLILTGCKFKEDQPTNADVFQPEIEAADQKIVDNKVIIDKASIPVDGWLVVYESNPIPENKLTKFGPKEEQGKMLGSKFFPQGKNENVTVEIKPTKTQRLMFMILVDKGQKGVLDSQETDHPYYYGAGALMTIINLQ